MEVFCLFDHFGHSGRPELSDYRSCSSIGRLELRRIDKLLYLDGVGALSKDLSCSCFCVQKFGKNLYQHGLNPRHVDDKSFSGAIDVVKTQFAGTLPEQGNRQVFDGKLVDICQADPLFNLTWNQHVFYHVLSIEVMNCTKLWTSDLAVSKKVPERSEVEDDDWRMIDSTAVNVKEPSA